MTLTFNSHIAPPCVGRHELFDSTHHADHELAAQFCADCPFLYACQQRLEDVFTASRGTGITGGPEGTWAGQLYSHTSRLVTERQTKRDLDRLALEENAYTDADAKRARAAWESGDRTDWATVGNRVYQRRRMRAKRKAA